MGLTDGLPSSAAAIDAPTATLVTTVLTVVVVPLCVWAFRRLTADYRELWELRELVEEYRDAGVEIVKEARLTKKAVTDASAAAPRSRPRRPDPGVIDLHRGPRRPTRRRP